MAPRGDFHRPASAAAPSCRASTAPLRADDVRVAGSDAVARPSRSRLRPPDCRRPVRAGRGRPAGRRRAGRSRTTTIRPWSAPKRHLPQGARSPSTTKTCGPASPASTASRGMTTTSATVCLRQASPADDAAAQGQVRVGDLDLDAGTCRSAVGLEADPGHSPRPRSPRLAEHDLGRVAHAHPGDVLVGEVAAQLQDGRGRSRGATAARRHQLPEFHEPFGDDAGERGLDRRPFPARRRRRRRPRTCACAVSAVSSSNSLTLPAWSSWRTRSRL